MKPLLAVLAFGLVMVLALNAPFGIFSHRNVAVAATEDQTFAVVNSGISAYLIDGSPNADLMLTRGQTYTFNVNSPGHPFFIKTTAVTGSGSQWTEGVTGQGATAGNVVFVVPTDAPDKLFYQCGVHAAMGGSLNIADPLAVPGHVDPTRAWLRPAAPNPTRSGAAFQFGLPRATAVDLALYDVRGARVRALASGVQPAGEHTVRWDGRDAAGQSVASGAYFYRLIVDGRQLGGRLAVTR